MSLLGVLGGSVPRIKPRSTSGGGGASPIADAIEGEQILQTPLPEGMPAETLQVVSGAITTRFHDTTANASIAATPSFTDLITRTFTVADAASDVLILAHMNLREDTGAAAGTFTARIDLDGVSQDGADVQYVTPTGSAGRNIFSSSMSVIASGLAIGSHTVKFQASAPDANYLNDNTTMDISELKR